tara:strand:- start:15138 stop:15428 length:291 start_codon:yes stop_codon:yes gene_type:complete
MEKKKVRRHSKGEYAGIIGLKAMLLETVADIKAESVSVYHRQLLTKAAEELTGFHQDIAKNALRYKNISDRQAYFLAIGMIEAKIVCASDFAGYAA